MLLNYFKSTKILPAEVSGAPRFLLSGVNLMFAACLLFVLWKSAILLPVTIACEILAKFLLSHLMEKWLLRMKEKVLAKSIV